MNICMVGYGMMGVWHTEALLRPEAGGDVVLHTVVGRQPQPLREFAQRFGYRHWTTSLDTALADPAIDVVILATPSEHHEAQALACFAAGKNVLIEIPIAMSLAGAERVVAAGERAGVVWGLCHPMRFRRERIALRQRIAAGEEHIRHIAGRFFIKRLTNVGGTGYARSWTDNLLWHHFCHFVDLGMFLFEFAPIRRVQGHLGPLHPTTGVPMEAVVLAETEDDRTLLVHGSYHSDIRYYDKLIVTDRDTYFSDSETNTLRTSAGVVAMDSLQMGCAQVIDDLLAAVREGRKPLADGRSALPAMRVLQAVQDDWDTRWGAQSIPGRPL
jgi:2-hydroxy-4-carboxymuconate semialdehyde hemiacetal dehydrogenase